MLARLLQRLIALILGLLFVPALILWGRFPMLLVWSLLTILAICGLTFAIQCVASAKTNRHDQVPRVSNAQLLRAWANESWVAAKVFLWWQPFRSSRFPDILSSGAGDEGPRGIVLVHGFVCNRGIWNAWYPVLKRRTLPFVAINLEPIFASIDDYVSLLDEAIERMRTRTGKAPMLVCHSMGGVVARAWLRGNNSDARVHCVVTIGSPHHGTRLGHWAPQLNPMINVQQMRYGSAWLNSLARQETIARRAKFVCFYSNCDNIVYPATSATLPGADNRHIAGLPHLAMALDDRIIEQSLALL